MIKFNMDLWEGESINWSLQFINSYELFSPIRCFSIFSKLKQQPITLNTPHAVH